MLANCPTCYDGETFIPDPWQMISWCAVEARLLDRLWKWNPARFKSTLFQKLYDTVLCYIDSCFIIRAVLLCLGKAATEVRLSFVPLGILGSSRCLKGNVGALHDVSTRMESTALAVLQIKQFSHFPLRIKASSDQDTTMDISPTMWILNFTLHLNFCSSCSLTVVFTQSFTRKCIFVILEKIGQYKILQCFLTAAVEMSSISSPFPYSLESWQIVIWHQWWTCHLYFQATQM